eukprot:scaffold900_cov430-Prasinococcus_capsulatus_cf.AAC.14
MFEERGHMRARASEPRKTRPAAASEAEAAPTWDLRNQQAQATPHVQSTKAASGRLRGSPRTSGACAASPRRGH